MGQHNATRKWIELEREESVYRHCIDHDWTCFGCGRKYAPLPWGEFLQLCQSLELREDQSPYIEIQQENGVPIRICMLCAVFSAVRQDEHFRHVYPGQFQPHKITARMKAQARLFFGEWREQGQSYVHALADMFPEMKYIKEEFEAGTPQIRCKEK